MKVIAERPTPEMYRSGLEIDCQCARCDSSVAVETCGNCEDGYVSRYEEDPLWYAEGELFPCDECLGRGVFHTCLSSPAWCQANPLPGRETVERGAIEWFTYGERTDA